MTWRDDWLPLIGPVATIIVAWVALQPAYLQFKSKLNEEQRLARSSRAEADIRLMTLFTQLMAKAHAREIPIVAVDLAAAVIASQSSLAPASLDELKCLLEACVVTPAAGAAEQEAAIAAVAELGCRYEVLRAPALAGLEQIEGWHKESAALGPGLSRLRLAAKADLT